MSVNFLLLALFDAATYEENPAALEVLGEIGVRMAASTIKKENLRIKRHMLTLRNRYLLPLGHDSAMMFGMESEET